MAGIKISALPALPSAALTDLLAIVQSGTTYKGSSQQILDLFQGKITSLGAQTQALNMNTHFINNMLDPVNAQDAATKGYVDAVATGLNILPACKVATTVALTVTYANGTAGVGATLTNATTQAALTIDSIPLSVNDVVLVKNQVAPAQNGVYIVTNIGSGSSNWVMTRASYYDSAAEITPGDLTIINQGTVNAATSWVQTATVVTVGTDAINFSQFGATFPLSLTNGGTGASLTASNGGLVYSTASAFAVLSGTTTAGQIPRSGASGAPSWSTTTYPATVTSGSILYGSSSNVVGEQTYAQLAVNAALVKAIKVQTFSATGTYTPDANMIYCQTAAVGGGGSGGGTATVSAIQSAGAGGGGGAAGVWGAIFSRATIVGGGSVASVTIGAGGAAPTAGNNNGNQGGSTTLIANAGGGSTLLTATGGFGGNGCALETTAFMTPGGAAGNNSSTTNGITVGGNPGSNGFSNAAISWLGGQGGGSMWGGGGTFSQTGAGQAALANSGGGGGGAGANNGAAAAGAAGAAGKMIIIEYCTG